MWSYLSRAVFLAVGLAAQVAAQGENATVGPAEPLLTTPILKWEFALTADVNLGPTDVLKGNGVFLTPDGATALVTTLGATIYAFEPYSGAQKWTYQPAALGTSITRSHSGVSFAPSADYMVYSVVDNENSLTPETRVVALDFDGNEVWISEALDGVPSGAPLISTDGSFVFVVHNAVDLTTGIFTILDATGAVFYSESAAGEGNSTAAFGPPGIYHTPTSGNYDPTDGSSVSAGDFNTNDMIMWSQTPKPSDVTVEDGFMYGFQFPRDFDGDASSVAFFELGDFIRDFQSVTPPVMTNGGLSAYWSVTRSGFMGWTPKRFSRARSEAVGFTRNLDFPGQACFAPPALSSSETEPFVFGGSAANEFVRMNFDMSESQVAITSSLIMAQAAVDGEDRAVYYVEMAGVLHQANFDTLADLWNFTMDAFVEGEMAMTLKSDLIIVADTRGGIKAVQVADIGATEPPSVFPSDMPSTAPTGAPASAAETVPTFSPTITFEPTTSNATDSPSAGSTDSPVSAPTDEGGVAPVAPPTDEGGVAPTPAPVVAPTAAPVAAPTSAPTSAATRPMVASALFGAIVCLFL